MSDWICEEAYCEKPLGHRGPCGHSVSLEYDVKDLMVERDELRAEVERLTRERDEARAEMRELAEVAARNVNDASHLRRSAIELTRERDEARALAGQDCDGMSCPPSNEARADVARLREALQQVQSAMAATGQAPDGMPDPRRPLATAVWAALAAAPDARPQPRPMLTGVPGPGITVAEKDKGAGFDANGSPVP